MENSKTEKQSTSDLILNYILQNGIRVGDKLPTENELSKYFSLSRIKIREGIQGLKYMGILSSSTKGGTVVRELNFSQFSKSVSFQIAINNVDWKYLVEARLVLELSVIDLLCGKLTDEQLEELQANADCQLPSNTKEKQQRRELDLKFHMLLVKHTGNPVLIAYEGLLKSFFKNYDSTKSTDSPEATQEHYQIISALKSGNRDLAKGIMREHLSRYFDKI